ncbi:hypothetical protein MKX03_027945, partial [Papaver bracteatum]
MSIVPCSNKSLKRKTSSSSTNSPSSSLSPVRSVTMSSPCGHHHHRSTLDFFLDNEYRTSKEDLFTAIPQNPHYKPLDNYGEGIRGGLKVGLDVAFISIAQKLVNLGNNPIELSSDEVQEEVVATLTELEEMGYDCAKLWERFDTLRALSVQEQAARLNVEETIAIKGDRQVKAAFTDTKISELESELEKMKETWKTQEEEIEAEESMERSYIEERASILQRFRSA